MYTAARETIVGMFLSLFKVNVRIGVAKGGGGRGPGPPQLKCSNDKNVTNKDYCFFGFSFF